MSDVLERTVALIREGTLPVIGPLILVCLAMWIFIFERIHYLFGPPWFLLWPPFRRGQREHKQKLATSLEAYLEDATEENRWNLIACCRRVLTPYARFLLSVVGRGSLRGDAQADLRLAVAQLRAEQGIERSLLIISTLAKAAPLLGLLGTVTGMIQTFRTMMFASTSDPRALSSGISIALIATEVGLVVSLSGVMSSSWLNRRAQVLEEEINLASIRLQQEAFGPSGEVAAA
jgi:biopolymer transport protein ExbB